MYERMLNKQIIPTLNDIYETIGTESILYLNKLHQFMINSYELSIKLRFYFGNNPGWGYKYCHKNKHICYILFEKNAFTVMIQISKNEVKKLYNKLGNISLETKDICKQPHSCNEGYQINYRILNNKSLEDIKSIITIKTNSIKKKVS